MMKFNIRRIVLLIGMAFFLFQSCSIATVETEHTLETESPTLPPSQPTSVAESIVTPTPLVENLETEVVTFTPGEEVVQLWAVEANASSNRDDLPYHASQAAGEPNTHLCGDFVTAWQPAPDETGAWIDLNYFPYILPESISVHQSYYPAQISKIEIISLDEQLLTIFDASQTEMADTRDICPGGLTISVSDVEDLIRTVRIHINRQPDEPWTQIDAVGVRGWVAEVITEIEPTQAWVEQEFGETSAYTQFSNKNRINDLVFEGDRLWSASNGGVVAWDLSVPDGPDYVQAYSPATYALAYCDWEIPWIVAGGDYGVATLIPPYFDYGPYFEPLTHPGDENYGRVVALGCDNQSHQLWVGYAGFLSRYDHATQSWQEYSWQDGLPSDVIREITVIDNDVWVATANGVAVLRDKQDLEVFTAENSDLPCQSVHSIIQDEFGRYWMASSCGLLGFDGNTWDLLKTNEINGGSMVDILLDIKTDQEGTIWVADTYGVLCEFDPSKKTCLETLHPTEDDFVLEGLIINPDGRIALGDSFKGLALFDGKDWRILHTDDQLLYNDITAIAATPDGRLWLANGPALQYFDFKHPTAPWNRVILPDNAKAFSFYVANDGLWIGHTRGARFLPYLEEEDIIDVSLVDLSPNTNSTVTALTRDANGFVYFGLSSGLHIWDGSELRYENLLSIEDQDKNKVAPGVNNIYMDEDNAWVGSDNGLFLFTNGELQITWRESLKNISSFYSSSVGVVAPSPRDEGLLIAVGQELFHFDGQDFELVLTLPSIITSLYAGPYQIWLGTANTGFYNVYMDDTANIYWESPNKYEDLPKSYGIQAITMTDTHTLWVASKDNGLTRIKGMFGQ